MRLIGKRGRKVEISIFPKTLAREQRGRVHVVSTVSSTLVLIEAYDGTKFGR